MSAVEDGNVHVRAGGDKGESMRIEGGWQCGPARAGDSSSPMPGKFGDALRHGDDNNLRRAKPWSVWDSAGFSQHLF